MPQCRRQDAAVCDTRKTLCTSLQAFKPSSLQATVISGSYFYGCVRMDFLLEAELPAQGVSDSQGATMELYELHSSGFSPWDYSGRAHCAVITTVASTSSIVQPQKVCCPQRRESDGATTGSAGSGGVPSPNSPLRMAAAHTLELRRVIFQSSENNPPPLRAQDELKTLSPVATRLCCDASIDPVTAQGWLLKRFKRVFFLTASCVVAAKFIYCAFAGLGKSSSRSGGQVEVPP